MVQHKNGGIENVEKNKLSKHLEDGPSPPLPPDGGWGYMVVLAAFFVNFVVDGICFNYAAFLPYFLDEFKASNTLTNVVGSLIPGLYLGIGPIASVLANRLGCRMVSAIGGVMAFVAFFACSFSTNIYTLLVFYGLIGGIGFGLMYLPSIICVSFYFEKRRAFATGIAVCGTSVGTAVMSPMISFLIERFGWRGTQWILSGVALNCVIAAYCFRPLESPTYESEGIEDNMLDLPVPEDDPNCSQDVELPPLGKDTEEIVFIPQQNKRETKVQVHIPSKASFTDTFASGTVYRGANRLKLDDDIKMYSSSPTMISDFNLITSAEKRKLEPSPMARKDIFYMGSVVSLSAYSSGDRKSYMNSMTNMADEETGRSLWLTVLIEMFDFSLLKSVTFSLICLGSLFAMTGFFTPFVYLQMLAVGQGIPSNITVWLLTILGITNSVGRLIAGAISDFPSVDCLLFYNVALILAGVSTCAIPFMAFSTVCVIIYCVIFGFCVAAFIALRSIVLVDLLGVTKLTNSFGLLLLFQGIASFIGTPISGALLDYTGSLNWAFIVSGGMITLSGVICLPVRIINKWEIRRNQKYDINS